MADVRHELADIVQVADLSWRVAVGRGADGRYQRAVVRKDNCRPAFDRVLEMSDGQVDGEQLAPERAVFLLRWLERFREESEGLPLAGDVLLEDGAHSAVRGVDEEGERRVRDLVREVRRRGQGILDVSEALACRVRPRDGRFGVLALVSEQGVQGLQESGGPVDEVVVVRNRPQELPQLGLRGRLWEVPDGLDSSRQRADAVGVHRVAEEHHLLLSQDALGPVDDDAVGVEALKYLVQEVQEVKYFASRWKPLWLIWKPVPGYLVRGVHMQHFRSRTLTLQSLSTQTARINPNCRSTFASQHTHYCRFQATLSAPHTTR